MTINSKILITGGNGQIGQKLAQVLSSNNEVGIWGHPLNDIRVRNSIIDACINFAPDYVIHTAGVKNIPDSEKNPHHYIDVNLIGTSHLIEAVKAANVKKTVFLSTMAADYPSSVYSMTKRLGEKLFAKENRVYPGQFISCRLGTIISRASFVGKWIEQIRKGETILVTDLDCVRPLMSLDMGVEAILYTFDKDELYVPRMEFYELRHIVEVLESLLQTSVKYEIIGLRPGEQLVEGKSYMRFTGPVNYLENLIREIL